MAISTHLLLAVLVALARSAEVAARGSRGFVTAERILATTEVAVLDQWVEPSLSARSLDEV